MSREFAAKISALITEAKEIQANALPTSAPLYENVLNHLMGAENHSVLITEREEAYAASVAQAQAQLGEELAPGQLTPD